MTTKQHIKQVDDFDKAALDQLKEGLQRSYTDRFHVITKLMRRGMMLKKAKITHAVQTKK